MTDPAPPFDPRTSAPDVSATDFVRRLLDAATAKRPSDIRDQLDRTVATLGLGGCIDDVLLPTMHQIGTRWQQGLFDIETERLTTETIRGWLERIALRAPEPDPIAPLVLACGPSERHSIGLEALGLLLQYHRRPCRMLGPRTSVDALSTAVKANQPGAVVIVSHLPASRLGATQSLLAAAGLGANLFYAGDAFAVASHRNGVPGTYLGTNIQAACCAIIKATSSQNP